MLSNGRLAGFPVCHGVLGKVPASVGFGEIELWVTSGYLPKAFKGRFVDHKTQGLRQTRGVERFLWRGFRQPRCPSGALCTSLWLAPRAAPAPSIHA